MKSFLLDLELIVRTMEKNLRNNLNLMILLDISGSMNDIIPLAGFIYYFF